MSGGRWLERSGQGLLGRGVAGCGRRAEGGRMEGRGWSGWRRGRGGVAWLEGCEVAGEKCGARRVWVERVVGRGWRVGGWLEGSSSLILGVLIVGGRTPCFAEVV